VARKLQWTTDILLEDESFHATDLLALVQPRLQDGIYQLNEDDIKRTVWQFQSKKGQSSEEIVHSSCPCFKFTSVYCLLNKKLFFFFAAQEKLTTV